MFKLAAGNLGQAGGQRVSFLATVRFDVTDDHIPARGQFASRGFQHGEGFADAGAHAEKHLEATTLFTRGIALDGREQGVGIRSFAVVHKFILANPALNSASKHSRAMRAYTSDCA